MLVWLLGVWNAYVSHLAICAAPAAQFWSFVWLTDAVDYPAFVQQIRHTVVTRSAYLEKY